MTVTGIARLAVFEALCEASTQEVLRFSPDDPAVNEAAPPISASSASIQLPWTRRQAYLSAASSLSFTAILTLQAELQQLERIGGRTRSRR